MTNDYGKIKPVEANALVGANPCVCTSSAMNIRKELRRSSIFVANKKLLKGLVGMIFDSFRNQKACQP